MLRWATSKWRYTPSQWWEPPLFIFICIGSPLLCCHHAVFSTCGGLLIFICIHSHSLLSICVLLSIRVHWCHQPGQKGGSGGYNMDCQGAGYSLGYFPSLFMGIGHCVYVAFTFQWTGNDRDSPVVFIFMLALGSRTGFLLWCFAYAHIPQPREGQGELLAFTFMSIVLAVVFGHFHVQGGLCNTLLSPPTPTGVHWTPVDSSGCQWTPLDSSQMPVNSGWSPVEFTGLQLPPVYCNWLYHIFKTLSVQRLPHIIYQN